MGGKRKAAEGGEATSAERCFDRYEFHFHSKANIPGSKTLLADKIAAAGGSVVLLERLRHAVHECPQQQAGCVQVVVIYKEEKTELLANPCQSESRRQAAQEIAKDLDLQEGGLACRQCGSCHLLACGWAAGKGWLFMSESLDLDCAQTGLLAPLQCEPEPAAGVAERDPVIICDSDSEDTGAESAGQSATHIPASRGETVPGRPQADGGGTVILKHVQCPGNERFVSHLDLLSLLLQVNACKSTSKKDKDSAKTKAWAFKQASNVLRRLPGGCICADKRLHMTPDEHPACSAFLSLSHLHARKNIASRPNLLPRPRTARRRTQNSRGPPLPRHLRGQQLPPQAPLHRRQHHC